MIYDTLANISTYAGINERIAAGLKLLAETDWSKVEPGKYPVSDIMNYSVLEYESKPDSKLEAHDKYADIQYIAEGEEYMGVLAREEAKNETLFKEASDVHFFSDPFVNLHMDSSKFIVLYPQDGHAPGICVTPGQKIRRVVIKVKLVD